MNLGFQTRFEDWKAGHLSDARYKEKLKEVSDFLCEYEQGVQSETADECPPNKTRPLPIFQSESAMLSQAEGVLITFVTAPTSIFCFSE